MPAYVLRCKLLFVSVLLCGSYAYLHTHLTLLPIGTAWEDWGGWHSRGAAHFLTHLLLPLLPFSLANNIFLIEILMTMAFFFTLYQLLKIYFNNKWALLLSWFFLLLLPLTMIINYRYPLQIATAIYASDSTIALLLLTMAYYFCLKAQWHWFMLSLILASTNNGNAIIMLGLIPSLYFHQEPGVWVKPFLVALVIVIAGQLGLWWFNTNNFQDFCSLSQLINNWSWLSFNQNSLFLLFGTAGLPLFCFVFYDYLPIRFRPIRYWCLACFMAILVQSNLAQMRFLASIVLLLYPPICLAAQNWLSNTPVYPSQTNTDRFVIIALLGLLIFSCFFFIKPA